MKINLFDLLAVIVGIFWILTYMKKPDIDSVAFAVYLQQFNHWFTLFVIFGGFSILFDKTK